MAILALLHLNLLAKNYNLSKDKLDLKHIFRGSLSYFLAGFAHLIYFQINVFFVGILQGEEEAAIYNIAFLLVSSSLLICSALVNRYYMPIIYGMAIESTAKIYIVIQKLVVGLLIIGLFVSSALFFSAEFLINFIFTEKYQDSAAIMKILLLGLPFTFVASGVGAYLHTQNYIESKVKIMIAVAAINIVLVMIFLPIFGSIAAAWITVLCNILLCSLYCYAYYRVISIKVASNE